MKLQESSNTQGSPILLYGAPGIGKSTLASLAPNPVFIDLENGLRRINAPKTPMVKTWVELEAHLRDFYKSEYKTVVVDTIDFLEAMLHKHLCTENNWKTIEAPGYGKGYQMAQEYFIKFLDILDAIVSSGKNVILLAHEQIRTYQAPDQDSYDRYTLKINPKSANLIFAKMDAVLFAKIETKLRTDSNDDERQRAISTGNRILHCAESPAIIAKNRFGLNAIEPMNAEIFKKCQFNGVS